MPMYEVHFGITLGGVHWGPGVKSGFRGSEHVVRGPSGVVPLCNSRARLPSAGSSLHARSSAWMLTARSFHSVTAVVFVQNLP